MQKNSFKIFNYFFCLIVFYFISIKIRDIIINRIAQSANNEINSFFFSFYEVHNTGAAFNLFTGKSNYLILSAVIFIIILTVLVLAKSSKLSLKMINSMALLSSGMTVNTIERIYNGYVTDYIYFSFLKSFPVFNLPDVMIVMGAVLLAISLMSRKE